MSWRDEDILAYVDGEMDAQTQARFEAAMQDDAELAARTEAQRRLSNKVRSHYAPIANEAVPDRFSELLGADQPAARPGLLDQIRAYLERPVLVQAGGALASLMIGLFFGALFLAPGGGISGETSFAGAQLASALDRPAGNDDWQMAVTFRDNEGHYCRAFSGRETATEGLACRETQGWRVRLLINQGGQDNGGYQLAGSALPPALLETIDALIDGEPLDAEAIEIAAEADWVE